MGLTAAYNSHTLPEGRWSISKTLTANENAAKQELTVTHRIEIDGQLQGVGSTAIEAAYLAIADAYAANGHDFIVTLPDNSQSDQLSLLSSPAIGGVRVLQKPSLSSLENGQYATYLPVKIILEAEYESAEAPLNALSEFTEKLSFDGGGPMLDWYRPIKGLPTQGIVREADTYRAVQSGRAAGFNAYPALGTISGAPPPIWPQFLSRNPKVDLDSPEKRGLDYVNWPISWQYEFESASPLFGRPHLWPDG